MNKTYKGQISSLNKNQIFVFGSNTQGRHSKGAALVARLNFGAIYGQAKGPQGQSYAIITKDLTKKYHPSVSKKDIMFQIIELYKYANDNPHLEFLVAYSGEGSNLNNYTPAEMAEMFALVATEIPNNIVFEELFSQLVLQFKKSWI